MEFLIFIGAIVGLLITILTIRFLWMVPNELRDMNAVLRVMYYGNKNND